MNFTNNIIDNPKLGLIFIYMLLCMPILNLMFLYKRIKLLINKE